MIVRDRRTGRPVAIPISKIPEEIRPDNWFENAYWRHRPDGEDLEPLIIRVFVDTGIDFEKCILGLTVNKCHLTQIATPTAEQVRLAKEIKYYSELRW